nr:immunoglobulin heavy chain junction region [Macaca mulatta]MOX38501.1 immunoglobulin heavy chain junction region [Macaca mulatta]MOX39621.1 immunoglobulin heavy chain junction region [Macaca mulatta]MOX40421.1 immunoglobulin heavy chain junction region [Macaca mulatta]
CARVPYVSAWYYFDFW